MGLTPQGKPKKPKSADELLEIVREKMREGIDNSLNYADKFVKDPRPTTKELSEATFEYINDNTSLTIDVIRSAKDLLFPRKK